MAADELLRRTVARPVVLAGQILNGKISKTRHVSTGLPVACGLSLVGDILCLGRQPPTCCSRRCRRSNTTLWGIF
eukprot:scaffold63078_cov66-Cyclotella_meneghiniana.AAC.5